MMTKNEIPMALRAAYMALHRRTESQLDSHEVTADQFVLLATLDRGESLTQRELARRMPSDPSTVRAMLVLLEKRGLVERDFHPTDGRARTVSLSVAGKRKFRQLWKASEAIRELIFETLVPEEAELLVELLTRIAKRLHPDSDFQTSSQSKTSSKESP